ncbi:MAG: hypothetical protein ABI353_01210 [Isosphaeraceae bacterium]
MPETARAKSNRVAQVTHQFSLIYSGTSELTEDLENALFEAGCADALLGVQNGEVFLDFRRKAPSFQVALTSAVMDVERAGVGLELVRVEPA